MLNQDQQYYLALNLTGVITPLRFTKLKRYFGNAQNIWQAKIEQINQILDEKTAQNFNAKRVTINPKHELEKLKQQNIAIVVIEDELYPALLRQIPNPPYLLYYRGKLQSDEIPIAIVGSRKASSYGQEVATLFAKNAAQNNLAIVSGMAIGIDAISHQSVLANNGRAIAVLGSGLDNKSIYPVFNQRLAQTIIEKNGVIFSEYPPNTPPLTYNFPARNRIIAGLSLGVLVVEAAANSGSLITASFATKYKRPLFAVPGNIGNQNTAGTNQLIANGAIPVVDFATILDKLKIKNKKEQMIAQKILPKNKKEQKIYACLQIEPIHINKLATVTNIPIAQLSSLVLIMEMKGIIKNIGDNYYHCAQ